MRFKWMREQSKRFNRPVTEFTMRMDGRIEWICEHGVGHTVSCPEGSTMDHGCDGCCKELHDRATLRKAVANGMKNMGKTRL